MNDAPLSQRSPTPDPRDLTIARLYQALLYAHGVLTTQTMFDVPKAHILQCLEETLAALKSVPSLSPTPARGASSPESSLPESNNQSETP